MESAYVLISCVPTTKSGRQIHQCDRLRQGAADCRFTDFLKLGSTACGFGGTCEHDREFVPVAEATRLLALLKSQAASQLTDVQPAQLELLQCQCNAARRAFEHTGKLAALAAFGYEHLLRRLTPWRSSPLRTAEESTTDTPVPVHVCTCARVHV